VEIFNKRKLGFCIGLAVLVPLLLITASFVAASLLFVGS
jgi:hypothetical protein